MIYKNPFFFPKSLNPIRRQLNHQQKVQKCTNKCTYHGKLASSEACSAYTEYFAPGTAPTQSCPGHVVEKPDTDANSSDTSGETDDTTDNNSGTTTPPSDNSSDSSGNTSGGDSSSNSGSNSDSETPPTPPTP